MDFGKFRLGGELSDIEVVVEDKHLQLHRFPLYTRSNFFLKEFAKLGTQQAITLNRFPGGVEIFTVIADYCYNISVPINVDNVIGLRCGAKYLEMHGSGNLYEKTGIIIEGIVGNARRGKDLDQVVRLIARISAYQMEEATIHAFDQCISALVHHWNKCQYGMTAVEEIKRPEILDIIVKMDFEFFIKMLNKCKEKTKNLEVINVLVSEYILHILNSNEPEGGRKNGDMNGTNGMDGGDSDGESLEIETLSNSNHKNIFCEQSLKKIQTLLKDIQPNLSTSATSKWLKPLLEAYSEVHGSDEVLGSIAALMANQMDEESISKMSEQTIVSFAEKVNCDELNENTRVLIASHLASQVDNGRLTVPGFMTILKALDLNQAPCQDNVLRIISALNTKASGFTDEELAECLSRVDMKQCSIKALRHAQQSEGIPATVLLTATLDLCEALMEKNEASSKVIQEQEKEISTLSLRTYGMLRVDTSPQRSHKPRAASHSSLYTSPTRIDTRNGHNHSPTGSLVRVADGVWSDQSSTVTNSQDTNAKLSELLRKQRQNKLWK